MPTGFADDYSYLIAGLLDLFGASGNVRWLRFALRLQEVQDKLFWDDAAGKGVSGSSCFVLL